MYLIYVTYINKHAHFMYMCYFSDCDMCVLIPRTVTSALILGAPDEATPIRLSDIFTSSPKGEIT